VADHPSIATFIAYGRNDMPLQLVEQDQAFGNDKIVWKLPKDKFTPELFTKEDIEALGDKFQSKLVQEGKIDNNSILVIAWL
jgi:hypothetical protein